MKGERSGHGFLARVIVSVLESVTYRIPTFRNGGNGNKRGIVGVKLSHIATNPIVPDGVLGLCHNCQPVFYLNRYAALFQALILPSFHPDHVCRVRNQRCFLILGMSDDLPRSFFQV